jgi:hypothetical protein
MKATDRVRFRNRANLSIDGRVVVVEPHCGFASVSTMGERPRIITNPNVSAHKFDVYEPSLSEVLDALDQSVAQEASE